MSEQERFRLVGYVCDGTCFKPATHDGTMTYHQIFMNRPDTCRYAVMERFSPNQFIVVDMYESAMTKKQGHAVLVTFEKGVPPKVYTTEDAAVAATQLSYEG